MLKYKNKSTEVKYLAISYIKKIKIMEVFAN
jgi:hypothetical protein